jgi:hypothetical protein
MTDRVPLHIIFTMDCGPASSRWAPNGPKTWEHSARSVEGFCSRLLNAGYAATLFLASECAEEHAPMLEELVSRGVEIGLHIHPPCMLDGRFKRRFGEYDEEDQRAFIEVGAETIHDAVGFWPKSFRPGCFSASDTTFQTLYSLGFRQGSVSAPGRDVAREHALWTNAIPDAHYVEASDRLRAGTLPFLELPITSDAKRFYRTGYPYELNIEISSFEEWHRPLIDAQLERMAAEHVVFRSLCIYTTNVIAYHSNDDKHSQTLEAMIDYFDTLSEHYEIRPVTLAGAHQFFRQTPS